MKHTIVSVSMPENMIQSFLRNMSEFMEGTEDSIAITYVEPSAIHADTGMRMTVIRGREWGVSGDERSFPI